MMVIMTMLQVLYLQQNKLKSLPSSLGNLAKLTTLNLSENALKVKHHPDIGNDNSVSNSITVLRF